MNVLNIMQCTNLGGMEQGTLLSMRCVQSLGHTVEVLSLNPIGALGPALERAGIDAIGCEYRGLAGWRSFPAVRTHVRRRSADRLIMTGHNAMAMLAMDRPAREHRVLTMHFHHAGVMPRRNWKIIYRLALRRFGAVTFITDFIRREAEAILPELAPISHTLPYAFDVPPLATPEQREAARRDLELPKDVPLVGNAGWLIERKRFDVFLKVAARVSVEHPEARFVIAGDGPARPALERLASELKIADRVIWLGWQRQLEQFFHALDILLFNSDGDALGRTPLEALSYGVPIVASVLYGGLGEVIDRNDYGFLLDTHDLDGLADRVSALLSNPGLACRMAHAGRNRVGEVGSPEMHAARLKQILQL